MKKHLRLSGTAYMRSFFGLTQDQLAKSLGISRESLAHAENGRRPMPKSAMPMLLEMIAIAKKMPAPKVDIVPARDSKKLSKHTNNRVKEKDRLPVLSKKPFVTAQSSTAGSYSNPSMTAYNRNDENSIQPNVHLLQSSADCLAAINSFTYKKERTRYQLEYLRLEAKNAVNRGKELAAELAYVNAMIQSHLEIIAQFPATPVKRKLEHRNAKLHCKRLILEDRLEHFDAAAMLMREYNINLMVKQLELLDGLIDQIGERKNSLNDKNLKKLCKTALHVVELQSNQLSAFERSKEAA